jgi:hypothetical protein
MEPSNNGVNLSLNCPYSPLIRHDRDIMCYDNKPNCDMPKRHHDPGIHADDKTNRYATEDSLKIA